MALDEELAGGQAQDFYTWSDAVAAAVNRGTFVVHGSNAAEPRPTPGDATPLGIIVWVGSVAPDNHLADAWRDLWFDTANGVWKAWDGGGWVDLGSDHTHTAAQLDAHTHDLALAEILHVHPNGDDANSGQTWANPKRTVLAAYDALPAGGGEIRMANNAPVGGEVSGQGLWILGPNDPNWDDPPPGWRQQKRLRLVGGATNHIANVHRTQTRMAAGSGTDRSKPAVWLTGTNVPVEFMNVLWTHPAVAIRLGVASDETTRDTNTSGIYFDGCGAALNQVAGNGPCIDVGYAYWVWMEHCTWGGNAVEPIDSELRAVMLVKPESGGPGSGLIHIYDNVFNNGGVVYYSGNTAWALDVRRVVEEGNWVDPSPPVVDIRKGGGAGYVRVERLEFADAPGSGAALVLDKSVPPESVVAISTTVEGPATLVGSSTKNTHPSVHGSSGLWQNRLIGPHDASRRSAGTVAVRWSNLAGPVGGARPAPDGTTDALSVSSTVEHYRAAATAQVGDVVIAGVWAKGPSDPALGPLAVAWAHTDNTFEQSGTAQLRASRPVPPSGEWSWITTWGRVAAAGTPSSELIMQLRATIDLPVDFYGPVLLHTTEPISDVEAAETATHLAAYPSSAAPGDAALMGGQSLVVSGGMSQSGSLDRLNGVALPQAALTAADGSAVNSGDATTDAVIDNMRTRINELEARLRALNHIA